MTQAQEHWWTQACSDFGLFVHLRRMRRDEVHECHLLHYLQMSTEKLSKAYFWRSGHAPPKSHTGFVRFLKALVDRQADLDRIADVLEFGRGADLENWFRKVQTLAYALQNLAPAEAGNGPNPEYPWPHDAPVWCPAAYSFDLWSQLENTGAGRHLIQRIELAIKHFDKYC